MRKLTKKHGEDRAFRFEGKDYSCVGLIHSPPVALWKITKKPTFSDKADTGTKVQTFFISSGGLSLSCATRA